MNQQQPLSVAQWRKLERQRLVAARLATDSQTRASQASAMARDLDSLLSAHKARTVSVYLPIRGEPDLRPWMHEQVQRGTRIALPVAVELHRPLVFREWRPHAPLARGLWNIPYPAEGVELTPDAVLAPLVGFDREGYRLGNGGGFFDRTLAVLRPRPLAIGVGYAFTQIETIFPQPHDIPMDWIVTGASAPLRFERAPRPGPKVESGDRLFE